VKDLLLGEWLAFASMSPPPPSPAAPDSVLRARAPYVGVVMFDGSALSPRQGLVPSASRLALPTLALTLTLLGCRGLLLRVGKPRVEGQLAPSEFCRMVEK
jgi:hypothetical protein